MPKLKTHSGTKKKIRITRTGKIIRRRATGTHFLEKKSAARKRRIAKNQVMTGQVAKTLKRRLGA